MIKCQVSVLTGNVSKQRNNRTLVRKSTNYKLSLPGNSRFYPAFESRMPKAIA